MRSLVLAAALVLAAGGGATFALGQSGGVLNACYDSTTGDVRVITAAAPRACQSSETAVQLGSGPGPQGPAGAPGPAGRPGADDSAPDQVAAGRLPRALAEQPKPLELSSKQRAALKPEKAKEAFSVYNDDGMSFPGVSSPGTGKMVASLRLPAGRWVVVTKATVWELAGHLLCVLKAGADYDRMTAWESGMIAGTVVHRFKKPGRATVQCADGGGGNLGVTDVKITGFEVDKITNTEAPEAGL